MSETAPVKSAPTANIIGILQLVMMFVGIATLLVTFGVKTAQVNQASADIEKLASAVNDLAKAQANTTVSDAVQHQTINDILRRLMSLEGRQHDRDNP